MADSVKPDVERVNDDDNSDNQPAGEAASPHPEKTVPDPSHEEEEQLNKNEVRIKVVLLDGKDTTITCQVGQNRLGAHVNVFYCVECD